MPTLAGIPRARDLPPDDYWLLDDFDCGSAHPWETEINGIFRGLGRRGPAEGLTVRIAEDPHDGQLLGANAYRRMAFVTMPGGVIEDALYIQAFGVTERYRTGWRLPDGSRVGSFLIKDVLCDIQSTRPGPMPLVWMGVAAKNEPCHRVASHHGFSVLRKEGRYDYWVRPPGLSPSFTADQLL